LKTKIRIITRTAVYMNSTNRTKKLDYLPITDFCVLKTKDFMKYHLTFNMMFMYYRWRFSVAVTRWSRSTQLLYIKSG